MSSKFKVGDKVRLNAEGAGERGIGWFRNYGRNVSDIVAGTTGVVERVFEAPQVGCYVSFDNVAEPRYYGRVGWACYDAWLEPVAPALRFAVGDRIVVKPDVAAKWDYPIGRVYVIKRTSDKQAFPYVIDCPSGFEGVVGEHEIEPAPVVVEYGVGDRVRVRQAWDAVRTGVVYVHTEKPYVGVTCVKYDDGETSGFDTMRDVEFLEVIEKAKPVAPPAPAKPALKAGDKVRVARTTRFNGYLSEGAEGVVERIDEGSCSVLVKMTKYSPNGGTDYRGGGTSHYYADDELELIAPATPKALPVVTIAVSNLRFTRKGERVIVEANGKRVASVSVEELRKMVDVIEGEAK